MLRFRYTLASFGALAFVVSGACNNSIKDGDMTEARLKFPPQEGGTGGPCKPTSASCYLDGPNGGPDGVGHECMAKRDNTDQDHVQLRQIWAVNTKPPGLANHLLIPATLSQGTNFKAPDCNMNQGLSGYMLVLDWNRSDKANITNQVSVLGYADRVPDASQDAALAQGGLCMVAFDYEAKGLNPALPSVHWAIKPSINHRVAEDFDVDKDIDQLRATVKEGEGIFYYDDARRSVHGYSPVTYVVVNPFEGTEIGMSVVPIRDAELRITANDDSQNCVGRYRDDKLTTDQCELTAPQNPAWGCLYDTGDPDCDPSSGTCCDVGQGQARVLGHFRIKDLEQVPNILGETVCVSYVGGAAEAQKAGYTGAGTEASHYCSSHPEWGKGTVGDPSRRGDWCDTENKAKDGTCVADSWLTETYLGLSAFPIQLDPQGVPKTCVPAGRPPLSG